MNENKKINFCAKMTNIGNSKYILIPAKSLQFSDINDDDVVEVFLKVRYENE